MLFDDIDLDQALSNVQEHSSLISDIGAQIAWPVREAISILQLTHKWLYGYDYVTSSVQNSFPSDDPCNSGGSAAFFALRSGLDLLIYEAAQFLRGVLLYFGDFIKSILRQFHVRKKLAVARNSALDTQNLFHRILPSSTLRGWDALEIILDNPWPERRKIDIEAKKIGRWNAITFQIPELLVLLCSNLGTPIRAIAEAVCSSWQLIPTSSNQ